VLRHGSYQMPTNSILYRILTQPFLYQWVLATVSPLLFWAVLVKLARYNPGILPRIYPLLKGLAWGLWASVVAWGLCGLFGIPERQNFYKINGIIVALAGGTNLMYHWVRRRVDPQAYVKTSDGWWPAPKDL